MPSFEGPQSDDEEGSSQHYDEDEEEGKGSDDGEGSWSDEEIEEIVEDKLNDDQKLLIKFQEYCQEYLTDVKFKDHRQGDISK